MTVFKWSLLRVDNEFNVVVMHEGTADDLETAQWCAVKATEYSDDFGFSAKQAFIEYGSYVDDVWRRVRSWYGWVRGPGREIIFKEVNDA